MTGIRSVGGISEEVGALKTHLFRSVHPQQVAATA